MAPFVCGDECPQCQEGCAVCCPYHSGVYRREELAHAAGIFDGEGHTSCRLSQAGRVRLTLRVGQRHPELIERFAATIGFGNITTLDREGRPYWVYSITRFEHVQAAGAMLWHWLGPIKREQLALALNNYHQYKAT